MPVTQEKPTRAISVMRSVIKHSLGLCFWSSAGFIAGAFLLTLLHPYVTGGFDQWAGAAVNLGGFVGAACLSVGYIAYCRGGFSLNTNRASPKLQHDGSAAIAVAHTGKGSESVLLPRGLAGESWSESQHITQPAQTRSRKTRWRLVVGLAVVGALVGAGFACFKTMMYARPHVAYVYISIDDDPPGRYLQIYGITFFGVTIYEQVEDWEKFLHISRAWQSGLMLLFATIEGAAGGIAGARLSHRLAKRSS